MCADCQATLEISEYDYCLCSKNPIRLSPTEGGEAGRRLVTGKCGKCQDKKLSGLYAALPYQEKFLTRKLIYQFKYEPYIKGLAKNLAEIFIEHMALSGNNTATIFKDSVLMPIPLEIHKQKDRGYNQAEKLAKELSGKLKIPVITNNLVKIKKTESQMKLSKIEREKNLMGAFLVKNAKELKNKKIFLVDDVYTTGSTMEECTRVLRDAGAKQIWGIVIAREG